MFLRKINFLYDKHFPLVTSKTKIRKNPSKPWLTSGIVESIIVKYKLYKQFYQATNLAQEVDFHQKVRIYRNQIVTLNRFCRENYFKTFFETNKKGSKKIWYSTKNFISTKTSKKGSQQLTLNIDNKTISDDYIIASHFNSFFTSIAGKLLKKIPKAKKNFNLFLIKGNARTLFLSPTTPNEVANISKTFNLNKAIGPNSLPAKMLKDAKNEISEPLCTLINLSFNTGAFLNSLKVAKVIPVFKKGNQQERNNCRPLSLLSNITKLIEKLLHNRFYNFLNQNKCLFKYQFGFRNHHSTNHALINITEKIQKALDDGKFACGVFLDFQKKTFDTAQLIKKHFSLN